MITKQRIINTLEWMVADARHRFDDCCNNVENGSKGGYSPELTEAINLLNELRELNEGTIIDADFGTGHEEDCGDTKMFRLGKDPDTAGNPRY